MQNKKILTLCVVRQSLGEARGKPSQILLVGMKKRGFGMGRWNGFGGRAEEI